jgi:polysaccharide biosynthesis protein PslH
VTYRDPMTTGMGSSPQRDGWTDGGGTARSRVLFLTQVLPWPLDAGPKVRAYHTLRWLSRRADVHLVSFVREDDPPSAVDHLRALCTDVVTVPIRRSRFGDALHLARAFATRNAFVVTRDRRESLRSVTDALCRDHRFAAAHADQLWMAQYARATRVPYRVLDQHNAVYRIFERLADGERSLVKRWVLAREARHLRRYEAAQVDVFDHTLFVSDEDRTAIAAACSADQKRRLMSRSSVVPICVDARATTPISLRPDAHRVTVLGTMFWPPNVEGVQWFADAVWPTVTAMVPGAVLTVIGKNPPESLLRLTHRFGRSIDITGYVTDPRPLLEETAVFAVPLLSGGGMRVKILDAWAWGLPVVSTVVGAEGIRVEDGVDAIVAPSAAEFAEAIVNLFCDPERRAALGRAGRATVERQYDVTTMYGGLDLAYSGVLAGHDATGWA